MATTTTAYETYFTIRFEFGYCGSLGCERQEFTRKEIAQKLGSQEWWIKDGLIRTKMYGEYTWVRIEEPFKCIEGYCRPLNQQEIDEHRIDIPIKLFTEAEMEELREVHSEHIKETHGCEWDFDDDGYDDFMKFGSLDVYDFKRY